MFSRACCTCVYSHIKHQSVMLLSSESLLGIDRWQCTLLNECYMTQLRPQKALADVYWCHYEGINYPYLELFLGTYFQQPSVSKLLCIDPWLCTTQIVVPSLLAFGMHVSMLCNRLYDLQIRLGCCSRATFWQTELGFILEAHTALGKPKSYLDPNGI